MKVKAAVVRAIGKDHPFRESKPYSIEEVDLDDPGPGEACIKIAAAGVCHSDISAVKGLRPRRLPFVAGHEASGVVAKLGSDVPGFRVGDHVVVSVVASCGGCQFCVAGQPALCEVGLEARSAGALRSGKRRFSVGGQEINHFSGVSAFAEYVVVSADAMVKIDDDIPLDVAALFGCAVVTGVGSVMNVGGLKAGQTAAIIGLGGVGLSGLLAAQVSGARRLVAIDVDDAKLALAKSLGATDVFNAKSENCAEAVREATSGGLDMVFEFVGFNQTMSLAYSITKKGGTTVTAGMWPPGQDFALPLQQLVVENRTVKGSYMGASIPRRDIPHYLELYRRGRLPIDKLLSARIHLSQMNEALDRLEAGKVVRQVVTFD